MPHRQQVEVERLLDHLHEIPRGRGIVPYCTCPNQEVLLSDGGA